jgi:hypothetical protein
MKSLDKGLGVASILSPVLKRSTMGFTGLGPSIVRSHFMSYGQICIVLGWIWISLGITTGSILSLWSFAGPFTPPKGHTEYADLPRRLNRLAHIACFMLPLITIVFGQYIDQVLLSDSQKALAAYGMITCMIGVPLFLFLASFWLPFKYVASIPVTAGTVALYLMSWAHLKILLGWN